MILAGDKRTGDRRTRDIRLLIAAAGASRIGDSLSSVALAIVVYERSHSPGWVAVSAVVRILPYLLLSPAAGGMAERFGFRRVMVSSDAAGATLLLSLAALVAAGAPVAVLVGLAGAASVAGVPFGPARRALTPSVTGDDRLPAANAALAAVDNVALVLGPAIAAAIAAFGPSAAAFVVDGLTFAVSAACLTAIRPVARPLDAAHGPAAGGRRGSGGGFRAVIGSRDVTVLVAAVGLATFVYGVECVLFLMVADGRLGLGAAGVGVLYIAVGVGGLLATRAAARLAGLDGSGSLVVPLSLAASGIAIAALAATHSVVVACVLLAADGAAGVVLEVVAVTELQRRLAPELTARVSGVMNTVVAAALLAGFGLAPAMVSTMGVGGSLAAAGGLLPAAAVVLHRYRRGAPAAILDADPPGARLVEPAA